MRSETGERQALAALMARRVDGLIVLVGCLSNEALLECAQHLPLVVVGRAASAPRLFSMAVATGPVHAPATQHLLDAGQTRIAWGAALVVEGEFTESGGRRCGATAGCRIEFTASSRPTTRWPLRLLALPAWPARARRCFAGLTDFAGLVALSCL
jgi:DNA-binding LacI/PurR family transcriptional regulator